MKRQSDRWLVICLLVCLPMAAAAQSLTMQWGLQNTWSYKEEHRTRGQDLATHGPAQGPALRAFAFRETEREVREPMLDCFQRHEQLWDTYRATRKSGSVPVPQAGAAADIEERRAFAIYKAEKDPFCVQQAQRQAPELYFDFMADSADEYVLQRIEITTLDFSEYRGGGFFKEEAGYDIVLSHTKGTKVVPVDRKLKFSESGRLQLRLWSDNYYPVVGWLAPMGEYLIDIRFVFQVRGKMVSVQTGPFKIDV